ncbi:hypothetical protein AVEN_246559-1 [Araneus ventricosus]|uniref:Uncharacterized protein n=1 Tax=Araneus ventricosus TaxID=182803 RepID=A0A4Y2DCE4_ARAVE|nr:hypothetical protein AVEN_246559-1 [Araneus ventricosus]
MFESDAPTSVQKKGESLMGQDWGCKPGGPISPIHGDECAPLCPLLCGVLHDRPKSKPLNSRALVGPYNPIRLSPFPALESTSFNRWTPILYRDGFLKLISRYDKCYGSALWILRE